MRFFLDTEYIDALTFQPVSIGIVSEDGREFYAQWADTDFRQADAWFRANVKPYLDNDSWLYPDEILCGIRALVESDSSEFWGFNPKMDWRIVKQLFGNGMPNGWVCHDLQKFAHRKGHLSRATLPLQEERHNALADARWNRLVYEFLTSPNSESAG